MTIPIKAQIVAPETVTMSSAWLEQTKNWKAEPIVSLADNSLVGQEILRRGPLPVGPAQWQRWHTTLAEEVLPDVSRWPVWVAVNVGTRDLVDQDRLRAVQAMARWPVVFEWTETMASRAQIERAGAILQELRAEHKVAISIDDMGSGQDGLQRFLAARADFVKIDGALLHRARFDARSARIIKWIVSMCHNEGVKTIIEWIETDRDLDLAIATGAQCGQGYLWSHAAHTEHTFGGSS